MVIRSDLFYSCNLGIIQDLNRCDPWFMHILKDLIGIGAAVVFGFFSEFLDQESFKPTNFTLKCMAEQWQTLVGPLALWTEFLQGGALLLSTT